MEPTNNPFEVFTLEYQEKQIWWKVAKSYFDDHLLTEHQISSYNAFINEKLPAIITNSSIDYTKDNINYVVNFDNVYVKNPEFTEPNGVIKKTSPQDCRIRKLSYVCRVYANVTRYELSEDNKISNSKVYKDVFIGGMPCMILSEYCNLYGKDRRGRIKKGECPYDQGGYFIINGNEKVLISQDRMAHNQIFVFKCKEKETIKLPVNGSDKNKSLPCAWSAEVRSHSSFYEPNITTTYIRLSSKQLDKGEDQRLYVELPNLKAPVPWPVVFIALGVTKPEEMIEYVCSPDDMEMINLLKPSLSAPPIYTQEQALESLKKYVTTPKDQQAAVLKILREKLFQNLSCGNMKKCYLGYMTFQLLSTVLGRRNQDDRDHYAKKRADTAGNLINNLFKGVWKRVLREVKSNLEKKRTDDLTHFLYSKFTAYIKGPFSTGNWTATKTKTKSAKVGVSQMVNRHNYVATLSNGRRLITPNSDKNSKITRPRHLHSSQLPCICSAETPEGGSAGLIRNLSMMAGVTLGSSEEQIIDQLRLLKDKVTLLENTDISPGKLQDKMKLFVNGTWMGVTDEPNVVLDKLRSLRREGKIYYQVSISSTEEGVRINTDEGRLNYPFFVIRDGKLPEMPEKFNWQDLLDMGIIEYLDISELETIYFSMKPWELDKDHTHALVHPACVLGISASTIPFPDHNQSPRNIYQSAMGKQALGVYAENFQHRYDSSAHVLEYPQRPIVDTMTMHLLDTKTLSSGQNLIVAVQSLGYNQEDSVMFNKRPIDNGAMRSVCYSTYSESCNRKGNTIDSIKKPEKMFVKETRIKGYSKLDVDGTSTEGTPLAKRDVVIGKVNTTPDMVRDISVVIKPNGMEDDSVVEINDHGEKKYVITKKSAVVDKSILTMNEDSYRTVQNKIRQERIPQPGDKFASRSAQKGIFGAGVKPQDMIFSKKTGMSPDMLMNPHAFPSRMTIGQVIESLLGKTCSINGTFGDCTPFEPHFSEKVIMEELKKHGFDETGEEIMINGMTGEEMKCTIFMGPTYYQRLKHMVDDKIHARDQDGPRETLTRQPVEGRKRGGGFRMGEMETWCMISHGAGELALERLVRNSDGYTVYVCDYCGNIAIANVKNNRYECKTCQQNTAISKVIIPYAFKLFAQNLQATGIGVWLNVDTEKTLLPTTTPPH